MSNFGNHAALLVLTQYVLLSITNYKIDRYVGGRTMLATIGITFTITFLFVVGCLLSAAMLTFSHVDVHCFLLHEFTCVSSVVPYICFL